MLLLSNKELEERLSVAGNSLLQPPPSLDELLTLLDRIEGLLSKVAQSPARSMQTALSPLMKALVSEELLKHSDVDVQVAVAACISEITRITAPDAPYDDEKMKDVIQLIVSSFDNLSDTSSRSHQKRATILETVAKVRSCVIMLDLELDQMIIEMFQHFLKSIRVYHAGVIFESMETIMNLVFEESEYISPDLLNPILDVLKKNNKEVLPIAKKLAERVIQKGGDKLRPSLENAVNAENASLDDYNEVVASVCQKNSASLGHSDENIFKDQLVAEDLKEETKPQDNDPAEDVKEEIKPRDEDSAENVKDDIKLRDKDHAENVKEETKPGDKDPAEEFKEDSKSQEKDPALNGSPQSIACNSIKETGDEETVTDVIVLEKSKAKQQFDAKSTSKTQSDSMGAQESAQLDVKIKDVANGEALSFNCGNNSAESSDLIDDAKKAEQVSSHQEIPSEDIHTLPGESRPDEAEDTVKDTTIQLSPSKEAEVEAANGASPIQRGNLPDEHQSKRSGRTKRKKSMVKENTTTKKESEGANIGVNKKRRTTKKQHDVTISTDLKEGVSKNDAGNMSDSEARCQDSENLGDASNSKKEDRSLPKEDVKRGGRVKPKFEKDASKYSATEENGNDTVPSLLSPIKSAEDEVIQEETPRIGTKRNRTPGTGNTPKNIRYGKNLVGLRVEVWWPDDQMFYEGVISSFDSAKKRHKVMYNDGDKEVLNLRNEKWHFVEHGSVTDGGPSVEHSGEDASSNKKRKKKGLTNSETSLKHEKMDDPPRRKLKGNAKISGSKSKDDVKAEPEPTRNSEDETDKSEDDSQEPSKTPRTKASGKSKDASIAKTSSHKKKDVGRSTNSKVKTPQSGKSVGPTAKGKKKSSSSKVKETVQMEKTLDSVKSPETLKANKSQGSGSKSGKKRRK